VLIDSGMAKTAVEIINDSTKATLFGRFYEHIVSKWLVENRGYVHCEGKPRVFWNSIGLINRDGIPAKKLNEILKKYQSEKLRCIPDGIFKQNEKYYIWEAKNWTYTDGKEPVDQLKDLLFSMPLINTTKAIYKTQPYDVDGILFSWWLKPEGKDEEVESLLREIRDLIEPRTFDIFYTGDILVECIREQYPWYLEIIKEEEARINGFFKDLRGP
jgi:hypothetical protein